MRTFWMKYSWIVLLPACLNFWFGYFLWRTGTQASGAIFGGGFSGVGALGVVFHSSTGVFFLYELRRRASEACRLAQKSTGLVLDDGGHLYRLVSRSHFHDWCNSL
jgi:hypothetical protein